MATADVVRQIRALLDQLATKSAWDNRSNWIAAGCPHFNSFGQYGNDGMPAALNQAAWDEWARRFGVR